MNPNERLISFLHHITTELVKVKDPPRELGHICQIIKNDLGFQCTIFLLRPQSNLLDPFCSSFSAQILANMGSIPVGADKRTEGAAAFLNEMVMTENVFLDPRWEPYRHWAERNQVLFAGAWPIPDQKGGVLGVLSLYDEKPHQPSSPLVKMIETLTRLVGLVLQNYCFAEQLKKNEQQYRLIAEYASDMFCLLNRDLTVVYASPSLNRFFGQNWSERELQKVLAPKFFQKFVRFVQILLKTGDQDRLEVRVKNRSGEWRWLEVNGICIDSDRAQEQKLLLVARDITERKQYEESLNRILYYDSLTQLPNRLGFNQELDKLINRRRKRNHFVLFLLHIDPLEEVRALYGRELGDQALLEIVKRIRKAVKVRTLARVGEDQLGLIVDNVSGFDAAEQIAQDLLNRLKESLKIENNQIVLSCCLGIVLFEKQTAETMLLQAERALSKARKKGHFRYEFYSKEQMNNPHFSLILKIDLYRALEKGEFTLLYQPQVNIQSGTLEGVEALLRWKSEKFGLVLPGEFIKIAEETGLINQIGEHTLHQACLDAVRWGKVYYPLKVSFNLSYRQLEDDKFLSRVEKIIKQTGIEPEQLIFEITENILMEDVELSLKVLRALKELGIHISIDDFGVGYSSLSYLKRFPIDYLKIDRAFVRHLHEDPKDLAIVQAIVEMSRSLNLEVVAEGVESPAHVRILHELGCYRLQGYWFSPPVPFTQLAEVNRSIRREKLRPLKMA
mgnify:CR=1 FL=1